MNKAEKAHLQQKLDSHRAKMNTYERNELFCLNLGQKEQAGVWTKKANYQFKQWLKVHKLLHPNLYP